MIQKNWKNLLKKLFSFLFLSFPFFSLAYEGVKPLHLAHKKPPSLEGIEIKEHLGKALDLSLPFFNSRGKKVKLSRYFKGKPVLMTVIYYDCPNLCNFHLNGLFEAITKLNKIAGNEYQFIIVSMDSKETPAQAKKIKESYYKEYRFKGKASFLVGSKSSVKKLTEQLGFSFRWDNQSQQFAHIPVAYTLDSQAKISRYLYGVSFKPETLKLSLVEASRGEIGTVIDRILLFCYRFDPNKNRYTIYAYNVMRAGAGVMILILISFLIPVWLRERKK